VRQERETTVVFRAPDELQQVCGIGPGTVAGASPWLCFE
jgi:DNA uptake protein ComE-like DNA-binding protein